MTKRIERILRKKIVLDYLRYRAKRAYQLQWFENISEERKCLFEDRQIKEMEWIRGEFSYLFKDDEYEI